MAGGGRLVVLGVLDVQADPGLRSELPERVVTDSYGDGARLVFGLDDGTLCELPRQAVEEWAAGDGRWNRVLETVIEVDTFRQAYDALTPGGAGTR